MRVLVADHNPKNIQVIVDYDCTFDHEVGNPLAFEIDAVVSPANTAGIMNGGVSLGQKSAIQEVLRKTVMRILCSAEIHLNYTLHYLEAAFVPIGARHCQNVVNCNVLKQRSKESQFVCFMVGEAQDRLQNLVESAVQQRKPYMGLKHALNVIIGPRNLMR